MSDEENGGEYGSRYLVENDGRVLGSCVLSGEPSSQATLRIGEKGPSWFDIWIKRRGGHGGYTHKSSNAIKDMAALIIELQEELGNLKVEPDPEILRCIDDARDVFDNVLGARATDVVNRVTVNVGIISGGEKINVAGTACQIQLDLRCPVGLDPKELATRVREIVSRHEAGCKCLLQIQPPVSPSHHELVDILQRNARSVTGTQPLPAISIGGTDLRFWRQRGISAYVYGPTPHIMGRPMST